MQTIMPPKGAPARAQVAGAMQAEYFRLATDDGLGAIMDVLAENGDKLTGREARILTLMRREYDRNKKIPADEFEAFSVLTAQASHFWMGAKQNDDYASFAPYLQQIIDYSRRFTGYWGYEDKPYDAMLYAFDPALLTKQLDPILAELLTGTRALLKRVGKNTELSTVTVPPERQHLVADYLLRTIGFDMDAGNLYTTEHPFCSSIHSGDTRATTKFHPAMPLSSIFSVLHEGGHGVYDQNVSEDLDGTNLRDGASMGIHESQSRFWENIVGRSRAFWQTHLGKVNELSGVSLCDDPEIFFRAINAIEPSFIRIEADELTYNLHIIIRYEVEKAIFNEGIDSDQLPELWASKYQEYLGIRPRTYAEGVLQDSHWSGGMFGYFPSYTIGNLCAAQFADAFVKQHGPLEGHIRTPEGLALILDWQKQNIHRFGAEQTPRQIMERICGEDVNPAFFLRYMEKKMAAVYKA